MSDETYNGWSNRETWAISLHISNNEGDYDYFTTMARECIEETCDDLTIEAMADVNAAIGQFADQLKSWTEEVFESVINPEDGPANEIARMFVSDVGSWWRADFYEIAENWVNEARDEIARSLKVAQS